MKLKKAMIIFGTVCMLSAMAAGCGLNPEPAVKTEGSQAGEALPEEQNNVLSEETDRNTDAPQENAAGKWQVLEPEAADAVDADFLGKVWRIEEDSFFIAEKKVTILDDGSLSYSSPSSNADIPDSQLIHVIFDDDTRFYAKTTSENGEGDEAKEAEFQDLKEYMSVEMKGRFEKDEFHAIEVRFF